VRAAESGTDCVLIDAPARLAGLGFCPGAGGGHRSRAWRGALGDGVVAEATARLLLLAPTVATTAASPATRIAATSTVPSTAATPGGPCASLAAIRSFLLSSDGCSTGGLTCRGLSGSLALAVVLSAPVALLAGVAALWPWGLPVWFRGR
jgi:hypothetical protein